MNQIGVIHLDKPDVLDTTDGEVRATLPRTETSDSMSFGATHGMLYVSGDSGMSRSHVGEDGKVTFLGTDPALAGKTSIFVGNWTAHAAQGGCRRRAAGLRRRVSWGDWAGRAGENPRFGRSRRFPNNRTSGRRSPTSTFSAAC
jgi:hypothetical protein